MSYNSVIETLIDHQKKLIALWDEMIDNYTEERREAYWLERKRAQAIALCINTLLVNTQHMKRYELEQIPFNMFKVIPRLKYRGEKVEK